MAFKITKHETTVVESYAIALVTTSFGMYSSGDHQIKHVAWSAAIAVFGPVWVTLKAKAKAYLAAKKLPKA